MKLTLQLFFTLLLVVLLNPSKIFAQGCVAIRTPGGLSNIEHPMQDSSSADWELTFSYRYFKSFRHYKGDSEQKQRQTLGNEVINHQNIMDLNLTRNFNQYWSLSVGIPYLINSRSSLYEHGLKERHSSSSHGFGDMRIIANRWLFNTHTATKGNIQVGLGVKLPTGNDDYKSYFYNVTPNVRPVDQSIQLGDGGVGIIAEINGFLNLGHSFSGYTNLYYMSNPRNTNGTRTYLETLSPTLANATIMSVPDQYMARLGLNYTFDGSMKALTISAGGRLEGVPAYDIIGKSEQWRRPGYVISAEPSVSYSLKRFNFFVNVPIALYRKRIQSYVDKQNTIKTGVYQVGDAAFADYSLNFGATFRF